MIKLDIKPYCEECPRFCAVTTEEKIIVSGVVATADFYISCKHSGECEAIEKWLRKELKEDA